jgi:hypothetical protein
MRENLCARTVRGAKTLFAHVEIIKSVNTKHAMTAKAKKKDYTKVYYKTITKEEILWRKNLQQVRQKLGI